MILSRGCLLNVYDISDEVWLKLFQFDFEENLETDFSEEQFNYFQYEKYLGSGCAMPLRLTNVIVKELVRYISEKI